jgi:predicted ATP-grasp superfamily ATP-dependent carboligase
VRLVIYEMISAGGLGKDAPASLRHEGWRMLEAVAEDFTRLPGIQVATLLGYDAPHDLGAVCRRVSAAQEPHAFRELAARADAALVIAPETDDLLATRSQGALDAGCRLLGSSPEAIRIAGDKLRCFEHLRDHDLATPATEPWGRLPACPSAGDVEAGWKPAPREAGWKPAPRSFPCVLKPRHGAGAQATFLVRTAADWPAAVAAAARELPQAEFIVQPYRPGCAVSLALLIGKRQVVATPGAHQHLSTDDRFHYQGGRAPLAAELRPRAEALARRAVACVPGLAGYVGVDLVLGEEAAHDAVIEINPRLTTSYLGLRRLARGNLAAWWLDVLDDRRCESRWGDAAVAWSV